MTTMKYFRSIAAISIIGLCSGAEAQSQTRFNYQAQIRHPGDAVYPNMPVALQITIRMGTSTGDPVYQEVHSDTTTSIGLVNLLVGGGSVNFGDIDAIAWGDTTYFLAIGADFQPFDGLFDEMGGAPIVSVPIAEYSRNGGKPWVTDASGIHYVEGNVGVGTTADATAELEVKGLLSIRGDSLSSTRIRMVAGDPPYESYITSYDEDAERHWVLNMLDRDNGYSLGFYSDAAGLYPLRLDTTGVAHFRANSANKLSLHATSTTENRISSYDPSEDRKWFINMYDDNSTHRFGIWSDDANGGIGEYLMYIEPDGRTQVKCLEILGGCDINERFNSTEALDPGTVVIASSERPGEVTMTDKSYDQRVVGVISGANGIKPGLTLTQEGTSLDGTHPVALDGRVYVKVFGPVEVGDLLTTSTEPGKAMAVKNRKKAFGAVIGKALESDADGDGLVLMLVQPR